MNIPLYNQVKMNNVERFHVYNSLYKKIKSVNIRDN